MSIPRLVRVFGSRRAKWGGMGVLGVLVGVAVAAYDLRGGLLVMMGELGVSVYGLAMETKIDLDSRE